MTRSVPATPRNEAQFQAAPGRASGILRPCTTSIISRDLGEVPRIARIDRGKAAQRRRRLDRGLRRWNKDRELCAEPTWRIARVTLTIAERDPVAAIGLVQEFWRRVRQRWVGTRYFCWLELQARGAVHYHCIWLNPPGRSRADIVAWVDKIWPAGRTQVRFSAPGVGLEREMDYALGHAKKMGKKAYQQAYDQVPSQLRTFMSQQLEIEVRALDEHLDHDIWVYRPPSDREYRLRPGVFQLVDAYMEWVARVEHVLPPGGRCKALDHRRVKRGPPGKGAVHVGGTPADH